MKVPSEMIDSIKTGSSFNLKPRLLSLPILILTGKRRLTNLLPWQQGKVHL